MLQVTSYILATCGHHFLWKDVTSNKTGMVFCTCASTLIWTIVREHERASGHTLYMFEYERCTCWWSDKSVLLEVNSQEDSSVCCVFIGTMIHINNLASLPYSPFILFSSLPFDIPVCFHSQKQIVLCPESKKKKEKIQRALRKQGLYSKKYQSKWCNNSTPTMYGQKHSGITYLHLHMRWYVCPQTLMHTQTESHTQIETLNEVSG